MAPRSTSSTLRQRQAIAVPAHHSNNDRRRILHRHSLSLLSSTNKNDTTSTNNKKSPFDLLRTNIFSSPRFQKKSSRLPDVIIDSDYTLAAAFAILGIAILFTDYNVDGSLSLVGAFGGCFITLLGVLFAIQARRIRFVFNEQYFEIKTVEQTTTTTDTDGSSSKGIVVLKDSGENFVVGGANRWAYTSFVNWKFFPSLEVPILVYFKEIQTIKANGTNNDGQIHFFPAVANCKQLREQVSIYYLLLFIGYLIGFFFFNSHPCLMLEIQMILCCHTLCVSLYIYISS
jgi:hypothetical protein